MRRRALFASVFLVSACALSYELALGTLASFTLGDAVTEFSITLGLYLFAMGIGALVSKRITTSVVTAYALCEVLLAITGAASVPIVMRIDPSSPALRPVLYGLIALVGTLVGIELPLLLRLLKEESGFDEAVSSTLASDYAGALLASCLFPFVCMPFLGLTRTTLFTGAVNASLVVLVVRLYPQKRRRLILSVSGVVAAALVALGIGTNAWHLVPSE